MNKGSNSRDELIRVEEYYQQLLNSLKDGVYHCEPHVEGVFTWVNQAFAEMFGYQSPEEMIGMKVRSIFVDPDDRRRLVEKLETDGVYRNFISLCRKKDGEHFYAERTSSMTRDSQGVPLSIEGTLRDITERKSAEANISRQAKILNAINKVFREALTCETEEKVGDVCLSVAEDLTDSKFGFIGELNKETGLFDTIALSDPGWDACRLPNSQAVRLIKNMEIRGIDRSTLREEKSRIVNDPVSHPDRLGTPNGHPLITSFLGVPLKHNGKTFGMIGLGNKESGYVLEDQKAIETLSVAFVEAITRRRIESTLKESEKRYKSVSRLISDFVYHISINTENQLVIDWITDGFNKMTDYTIEDVCQPDAWKNIIHPFPIRIFAIVMGIECIRKETLNITKFQELPRDRISGVTLTGYSTSSNPIIMSWAMLLFV